jgi:hypothetical protein
LELLVLKEYKVFLVLLALTELLAHKVFKEYKD